MVDDALIAKAEDGDLGTLADLDAIGLLMGCGETLPEYGERLRSLRANIERMDDDLLKAGQFRLEGVTVSADRRIPAALFSEADTVTDGLYRFRIDWVPGFFINPRFSLLFGGCAFYFYPDFFALFIIRRAFEKRARWLIYSRRELLAHELCHVARIALGSRLFEETFAYQTATSAFRRLCGSVFRGPSDTFCFLGSTLTLLAAQCVRTLVWPWFPVLPFWLLVVLVPVLLAARQFRLTRVFAAALSRASQLAPGAAHAFLFRCADEDILSLARLGGGEAASAWLEERCRSHVRWRVIRQRFCRAGQESSPSEADAP